MKWEYHLFETKVFREDKNEPWRDYLLRSFNELGEEGWEYCEKIEHRYLFKREFIAKTAKKTGQTTSK